MLFSYAYADLSFQLSVRVLVSIDVAHGMHIEAVSKNFCSFISQDILQLGQGPYTERAL